MSTNSRSCVGLPPALVERALPFVTVFNGSPGVDAGDRGSRGDRRNDKHRQTDSDERPAAVERHAGKGSCAQPHSAASAKSPCYRIEASISFSNGRRTRSEAVIALGDKAEPYRVLSWQDDVEPRGGDLRKPRGL